MLLTMVLVIRGIVNAENIEGKRMERELLEKEKYLFHDIRQRLTKLEKSIDSRKYNGKPT